MATDALSAFLSGDFQAAETAVMQLHSEGVSDPRFQHNLLVSRFYAKQTQSQLDAIVEFVAQHLSGAADGPKLSKTAFFREVATDPSILKPLYATVGPVAIYNVAVIAYVEGYLLSAAVLGKLLYSNVEALDDWLALKTCFLLADVHLRQGHVSEAGSVAAYLERLIPSFSRSPGDENAEPSEIPRLAPNWPGKEKAVLESPASYEEAKFCMHIYNARLSGDSDSSRNIRKEAKSAVLAADDTESRPTAAALLVKARVEQSESKGLRILASVGNQSPPHIIEKIRPLALNSLGVLHHKLGRHALAACYFEHARKAFIALFESEKKETTGDPKEAEVTVSVLSSAKDSHVSYNLALQYMKLGDYARALGLFTIAARRDFTLASESALLWIRMAECCVAMEARSDQARQYLVVEGAGRGRRMVMQTDDKDDGLGMEYAGTCARAAIAILDRKKGSQDAQASSPQKGRRYSVISDTTKEEKVDNYDSSANGDDATLRSAALCLLAYSGLSFDPHAVLDACEQLAKVFPQGENDRAILGHLYAAEALCQLGRSEEAANRLRPLLAMNLSSDIHFKEAACMNMALAHVSGGNLSGASLAAKITTRIVADKQSPEVMRKQAAFVAAYVFLLCGEKDSAREVLRSFRAPSE